MQNHFTQNASFDVASQTYGSITKIDVAGPIDELTPLIVLREIMQSHDIDLSDLKILSDPRSSLIYIRNQVEATRVFFTQPSFTYEEMPRISKFVNKNVVWTKEELQMSLNFICNFSSFRPLAENQKYGMPYPGANSRTLYSPCMLYRLLRVKEQNINIFCTFKELAEAVRLCYANNDPNNGSLQVLYYQLSKMNQSELTKMYLYGLGCIHGRKFSSLLEIDSDGEDPNDIYQGGDHPSKSVGDSDKLPRDDEEFYNNLLHSANLFKNHSELLINISPRTSSEAIALAAINYNIDISFALDPILEYDNLQNTSGNYIPKDFHLLKKFYSDPSCLKLDIHFNPMLPPELYVGVSLRSLALDEGYTDMDISEEGPYSLLQTAAFSETFFHGKGSSEIKNKETFSDYEPIRDISSSKIIRFGSRIPKGGWPSASVSSEAFTYRELGILFRNFRSFRHPIDGKPFTKLQIRKLKLLCEKVYSDDQNEDVEERRSLLESIHFVEFLLSGELQSAATLCKIHKEGFGNILNDIFKCLLELGFYMRSWDGISPYPVEDAPFDNENPGNVYINVTNHIILFEEKCQNAENLYSGIGNIILNVPLIMYDQTGYYVLSNSQRGRTNNWRKIENC